IASDDRIFLGNIRLKSLAASVVQIGLYDRYVKHFKTPEYILGNFNGDSAMKVAAGLISLEELLLQSNAIRTPRPLQNLQLAEDPVLAGISLTEYGVLQRLIVDGNVSYRKKEDIGLEIEKILTVLVDDF